MTGSANPRDRIPLTQAISAEPSVTSLYRAAIGPISTDYYLPVFTSFEAAGRAGSSWNWAACFCTLNWLAFRNLWEAAFIYVATVLTLPLLVLGVGRLAFRWSETVEIAVLLICLALAFVIPGMFGNAIFQKKSRQRMNVALSVSATLADACKKLSGQSSTRKRFIWIVVINMAAVSVIVSGGVFILTRPALGLAPMKKLAQAIPISARSPPPDNASAPAQLPSSASTSPSLVTLTAPNLLSSSSATNRKSLPIIATSTPVLAMPLPTDSAHFYVNVGLFANTSNANNAHARLEVAGLPVVSQTVSTSKGTLTRVRAGPFDSSSEAKEAIKHIEALGLDAKLVQQ